MKPSQLAPGQRVVVHSTISNQPISSGTFIRRMPRTIYHPARSFFHVDEFAGLRGPDDKGEICFSDYEVSRFITLPEVH